MVTLEEITVIGAPIERCFDLARSVEVHLAGNVHCGESAVATAGVMSGLVGLGQRVTWRAKHFGIWHQLTSEITSMDRPVYFQDPMIRGPFVSWSTITSFGVFPGDSTEMKDVLSLRRAAPDPRTFGRDRCASASTCGAAAREEPRRSNKSPNLPRGEGICRHENRHTRRKRTSRPNSCPPLSCPRARGHGVEP